MKVISNSLFILFLISLFGSIALAMRVPEDPKQADLWYQDMAARVGKLALTEDKPTKFRLLGDYVFKFGRRRDNPPDSRWADIYRNAQQILISTPGHAEYFADEVERFRKEVQHLPRMNQVGYDRERQWLIAETLRHLPSPETIQVLGHYLDDERDTPPELVFLPENSFLGCVALSEIGLRNPPVSARPGMHNWREELVKQNAWYAQVKAGTIPFSFVGQKVEYRFKPDGTWETTAMINPPDDGPSRIEAAQPTPVRPPKRSIVDSDSSGRSESDSLWPWLIGIPALLLAGVIWLRFRNFLGLKTH